MGFGLQHVGKKAPTLREEMNCQPKILSIMTTSKSVPTGSGELTPGKPIKRGERWNKTSGLEMMGAPSMKQEPPSFRDERMSDLNFKTYFLYNLF